MTIKTGCPMSREEDIQAVCKAVMDIGLIDRCPFCLRIHKQDINEISHKSSCAYLIAKDLMTKGGVKDE